MMFHFFMFLWLLLANLVPWVQHQHNDMNMQLLMKINVLMRQEQKKTAANCSGFFCEE